MKEVPIKPKIVLTDEEKKRLVAYFNVLIEMHFEYKRNHKGSEDKSDVLLNITSNSKPSSEYRPKTLALGVNS